MSFRKSFGLKFAFAATILAAASVIFTHGLSAQVSAAELSEDQTSAISQSCQTIKQNLKTLQKTDSRTRSYLGSIYQTFLSNYITPLNLSLIKHNRPSTDITGLYSDFLSVRTEFANKFTSYSQSFEELLNIDCKNDPINFYDKLEEVRKKRSSLNSSVKSLRTLLGNFYIATSKLKEDV